MNKFLTMQEKKELALAGKDVPLCVKTYGVKNNNFISKIRSIWDGSIKNKKMKI